ncbi:MAG: TrmH family RNA methyltransferase [Christensenellales bacterium]
MVYKGGGQFDEDSPHIVLHHPSDSGNLGTILRRRSAGLKNIAIIRPAVDSTIPAWCARRWARRSAQYCATSIPSINTARSIRCAGFSRLLTGAVPLDEAVQKVDGPFSLVFGNEASGLPDAFAQMGVSTLIPHSHQIDSLNLAIAAGIGMYAFTRR